MRVPRNGKMCKDKWNVLNFDYKKLVHYHKRIRHLPPLWDLTMEEWEKYHLLCHFNKKSSETINAFQGKIIINTLIHVQDL
jgi:hypothetical protein